jgi:hypothetical protein
MLGVSFFAHAFGQRYELPIPLYLFILGGAGAVFLSFLLVVRGKVDEEPKKTDADKPCIAKFRLGWAASSFIILAGLITAGLSGSQEVAENILPVFFWLVVWVLIPLSCGIFGDWTQRLNPFSNIAKLADSNKLRQSLLGRKETYAWPKWLGWWFAGALYFALACGELIFNESATKPSNLALALLIYFIVSGAAGLLYGRSWLERGEIFSVLYYTWGKLGYFRFGNSGQKSFAGGLVVPFEASFSRVMFVLLLLASISFDGLLSTPLWNNFQHKLPESYSVESLSYQLLASAIFLGLVLFLWALFSLFAAAVSKAGGYKDSQTKVLAGLLPSIVPISFGYLLAHYIQYLIVNGQLFFPLIGNPIGKGSWPIHLKSPFNDAFIPNTHLLPSSFYWYFAVIVIIVVHIIAVILAHKHLGSATRDRARARRSEYPWIAAMVAYTMLSLWLLAQPLVKEKAHTEESFVPTQSHIQLEG